MGIVHADIELINAGDIEMVRRNMMDKDDVKRMVVYMLVDSGAYMMAFNESIQQQLDLTFIDTRKSIMADGSIVEHVVVGPIIVKFKNRTALAMRLYYPEIANHCLEPSQWKKWT